MEWSAEACRSFLSYLSVASTERNQKLMLVLAAPCHPSQLYGLTLLADAGLLSVVVLLEQRKPKSWGVFEKRGSSTGHYLNDIGLTDCGWVEWDSGPKSEHKLDQVLEEAQLDPPSFFVVCCRDQEASEEPVDLVSGRGAHYLRPISHRSFGKSAPLQTVFGKFLQSLEAMVPQESIFWVPEEIKDLDEFRRQLGLFRRIQQGTPGRPVLVLDSAVLPTLYADIRNWCESPDRDNPIFLIYRSGLPTMDRGTVGGLTDGLLLLSIPGLNLSVPADEQEAQTLFQEADSLTGPAALTFCQTPAVGLSTLSTPNPGKGRQLREGKDLALVAIGSTVFPCLLAAESLQTVGLSVAVYDLRYRRPLDRSMMERLNRFPLLVAVDEHPESGGIASHLWRPDTASCKLVRLSIEVEQVQEALDSKVEEDLSLEHFDLHAEGIARIVRESLRLAPPSAFG